MGAQLIVVPGGTSILGASLRSDWSIGINDRIVGSELEWPVVLHETGHLLTFPRSPLAAGCQPNWRHTRGEVLAWCGAGRLSVSALQGAQIDRQEATLAEIAVVNGVPPELVGVGLAILHQLHRPVGVRTARARDGNGVELFLALARWHTRLISAVERLMAAEEMVHEARSA